MNIHKIVLSMMSLFVSLSCAVSPFKGKRIDIYDLSAALEVKRNIANSLDYFEESNDGEVFVASAIDASVVKFPNESNDERFLAKYSGKTETKKLRSRLLSH